MWVVCFQGQVQWTARYGWAYKVFFTCTGAWRTRLHLMKSVIRILFKSMILSVHFLHVGPRTVREPRGDSAEPSHYARDR